jgi:hypothetical protein
MMLQYAIMLAIVLGTADAFAEALPQPGTKPAGTERGSERSQEAKSNRLTVPGDTSSGTTLRAPDIVAQGRCYNGHCF